MLTKDRWLAAFKCIEDNGKLDPNAIYGLRFRFADLEALGLPTCTMGTIDGGSYDMITIEPGLIDRLDNFVDKVILRGNFTDFSIVFNPNPHQRVTNAGWKDQRVTLFMIQDHYPDGILVYDESELEKYYSLMRHSTLESNETVSWFARNGS